MFFLHVHNRGYLYFLEWSRQRSVAYTPLEFNFLCLGKKKISLFGLIWSNFYFKKKKYIFKWKLFEERAFLHVTGSISRIYTSRTRRTSMQCKIWWSPQPPFPSKYQYNDYWNVLWNLVSSLTFSLLVAMWGFVLCRWLCMNQHLRCVFL